MVHLELKCISWWLYGFYCKLKHCNHVFDERHKQSHSVVKYRICFCSFDEQFILIERRNQHINWLMTPTHNLIIVEK